MSDREQHLPPGWARANIGELVEPKVAQGVPAAEDNFKYIDIGSIDNQTKRIDSPKVVRGSEAPSRARQHVRSNDVLVSMTRPNLNAVAKVPESLDGAICSTGFDVLRATGVEPDWLFFTVRLKSFVHSISELVQGALYPAVRPGDVRAFELPVPPLKEQQRIVAKIDALQRRTRRAREALAELGPLLGQFRQSLLAAAFRGDLTADWRAAHPDVEPASEFLARIRAERSRRWEEAELAKYEAAGKKPPKNWRDKYRTPDPADEPELPELPTTWRWITWNEISEWITYGFTRPMPHVEDGFPIVTAKNILTSGINFNNVDHTTEAAFEDLSDKDRPLPGDVLITKDGTIGRAAMVSDSRPFCINQSVGVIMLRFCPIDRRFLLRAIEAPFTQDAIAAVARGMAMKHLSITDFGRMAFPLPPAAEQAEVIAMVEAGVERLDALGQTVAEAMLGCNALDQSIVAKAFRGELVPQDPNDEPASVLLERIRAEKAKQREARKKSKPSRSSKMARSSRLPANVRRPLPEVLGERAKPMSPEELLEAAGYNAESIEDFYLALREAVREGTVREHHPEQGPILLEHTRP